ncbi:uncharacterized protein TNCV_1518701 [Trichonephila clavipes]|nr:uncharacterized protein TNCV_1518701 [Trichonephila clavipes]
MPIDPNEARESMEKRLAEFFYRYLNKILNLKEGRFVLGTFRSERMRVLCQSRQSDRLRVMLVLVHIDITPPHTPLPMIRRIGEQTIPYSWRAIKQSRHV